MDEIVIYEMGETQVPEDWDYDYSVTRMRGLVLQWKNISIEILEELYIAKQKLSAQGARNDLDSNGSKLGWEHYLNEVGLSKETVRRWLSKYNPETKLILPKEVEGSEIIDTKHKCPNCAYSW
jgi:hypothetical protein